jgi:hypothetical protein
VMPKPTNSLASGIGTSSRRCAAERSALRGAAARAQAALTKSEAELAKAKRKPKRSEAKARAEALFRHTANNNTNVVPFNAA